MKKVNFTAILAIFFIVLPMTGIFAQVSITASDMPNIGDTIRVSTDVAVISDPSLTGTGYTWNYTELVSMEQRVDTFVSVISTPVSYNWIFNNPILYPPAATIAQPTDKVPVSIPENPYVPALEVTDTYDFFRETSASFSRLGFASKFNGIPIPMKYDNPEILYEFPLSYGISYSSTSFTDASIPGFGYYGQTIERTSEVDGWGTLILGTGAFEAVRVKSIVNITDTLYLDSMSMGFSIPRPEKTEYLWMTPGCKIPQLQIDVTNFTTTAYFQGTYIPTGKSNPLSEAKSIDDILVYPNPVSDYLIIDYKTDGHFVVSLSTLTGKTVYSYTKSSCENTDKIVIYLNELRWRENILILTIRTADAVFHKKIVTFIY